MHTKRRLIILLLFLAVGLQAQIVNPVHWSEVREGDSVTITATIDEGWHMTLIAINDSAVGEEFTGEYVLRIGGEAERQKGGEAERIHLRYNACNDEMCTAPDTYIVESLKCKVESESGGRGRQQAAYRQQATGERSLGIIFLLGLLGGLLAIFTPCVWPIIPMTVSFFLKADRRQATGAILYGLSIIIIYVGLGLLITILFGASALNAISTNAIVNLFFFALLVVFALSFFGLFEITLPSSWSTKLDNKARNTTGFLSILLMAFTLVIVSFSCTGPIIGTLLVEAAGRSLLAPTIGMLGFAIALALPFSLFAMFPTWMQRLPKSGEWMQSFKVCLAFVELALSLKFLSVADLAYGWGILPRWLFFVIWTACFAALGLYLLVRLRKSPSLAGKITAAIIGIASMLFSVYSAGGIFGKAVPAVAAFAPPMKIEAKGVLEDYNEGIAYAKQEHKPILIDFSGYGCVNCRKMEANVIEDAEVQAILQDYVLIVLYVDSRQDKNGNGIEDGEEWSQLQRERFGSNAQPYWVRLTPEGQSVGEPLGFTASKDEFINWINTNQ